jgi:thioredoxin-like negative regulator of GroEL
MSPRRSAALVDAGVFLQLSGDITGARELFRQALTMDPENKKARVFLGEEPTPTRAADAFQTLPTRPPVPREVAAGNDTVFAPTRHREAGHATLLGRPLFPSERGRIMGYLAAGEFDKALGVALERMKVDADDVEAHELAWDVLVAAGQVELARAQLGHLMEVAVARQDTVCVRRFVDKFERTVPEHPLLPRARAMVSEARVAERDSTLIDDALRSVL